MSNEEKILTMLSEMKAEIDKRFDKIEAAQAEMQATQAKHGKALAEMQAVQAKQGELLKELDERSLRSAVLLEGEIAPKVQVLFEGHKNLQDTLAPIERVEKVEKVVEERVVVLEAVVKSHSERISKLEKAQ